jgi:gliding motility-associated-like protein
MKLIIYISLFLSSLTAYAQVQISHQVIGSTGNFSVTSSGTSVSSTVGESAVTTLSNSNNTLTQGFQQPASSLALKVLTMAHKTSCNISKDGFAVVKTLSGKAPFTYLWGPEGGTDDTAKMLAPGRYWVTITAANGFTKTDTVLIAANDSVDCKLIRYNAFSPNNDLTNDTWVIDGIGNFPDNNVVIFNRWGDRVWEANGYNNQDIVWTGLSQNGNEMPDGTYFYIIKTSVESYKGWVEITR